MPRSFRPSLRTQSRAIAALLLAGVAFPARAQDRVLRVLHHAPDSVASVGQFIAVTFDRPIAGAMDQPARAARLLRISPSVSGVVRWRDPVTLELVPSAALVPGQRYAVTVSPSVRGSDGARLRGAYTFSFLVGGARVLAPPLPDEPVAPDAPFQVLYSAPVDPGFIARYAYVTLPCRAGTVFPLRVRTQRPLEQQDPWLFQAAARATDSLARQLLRVVSLESPTPLPADCRGSVTLPSLSGDSGAVRTRGWSITTRPTFRVLSAGCEGYGCGSGAPSLTITFSTPVAPRELLAHVHLAVLPSRSAEPWTVDTTAPPAASWTLRGHFVRRQRYRIIFDSALTDRFGRTLGALVVRGVDLPPADPAIAYQGGAVVLAPRRGAVVLPVAGMNLDSIRVESWLVPDSLLPEAVLHAGYGHGSASRDTLLAKARRATTRREDVRVQGALDSLTTTLVTIPPAPRGGAIGYRLVGIGNRFRSDSVPMYHGLRPELGTVVLRSDLAASVVAGVDGWHVWVTSIPGGAPVRGARIELLDTLAHVVGPGAMSGGDGGAVIPPRTGAHASAYLLRVSRDADTAYVIAPVVEPHARAAVFTDRGVYRPGDTVRAAAIARSGALGQLRPLHSTTLRWLLTSDGYPRDSVAAAPAALSTFGTADAALPIRRDARIGNYTVHLQEHDDEAGGHGHGEWRDVGMADVSVAEYRAPDFVVAASPARAQLVAGDTARVRISARYLFDAAMRGARLRWTAETVPASAWEQALVERTGYQFGAWVAVPPVERHDSTTLAGDTTVLSIATARDTTGATRVMNVEAAVSDIDNQVVAARTAIRIRPALIAVGVRRIASARRWYGTVDSTERFAVIAVDTSGRRVSSVPIDVTVISTRWVSDATAGSDRWRAVADTVLRETLRTGADSSVVAFTPRAAGDYELHVVGRDSAGRRARTDLTVWVVGQNAPRSGRPAALSVALPSRPYSVGDTMLAVITAPHLRGDAWIRVEREGVLAERRIRITGVSTTVPFAVTRDFAPGGRVTVALVTPDSVQADSTEPSSIHTAQETFTAGPELHRLAVNVHPDRAELHPRDTTAVVIATRDAAGHPASAEVTLWAVDEGVLALTHYQLPQPVSLLYSGYPWYWRHAEFSTLLGSLLRPLSSGLTGSALIRIRGANALALSEVVVAGVGAVRDAVDSTSVAAPSPPPPRPGGGQDGVLIRSSFATTPFFVARLRTDSTGRAVYRGTFPDNLTRFRLMAVATTEGDEYGSGQSSVLVSLPLVVRPELPRFVRDGDSLLAGVSVHARDSAKAAVSVSIAAVGARLTGERNATVGASSEHGVTTMFPLVVTGRDSLRVEVRGAADTVRDAARLVLPVRPTGRAIARGAAGEVRGTTVAHIEVDPDIDVAQSRLTVRVGTGVLPLLQSAHDALARYRYDCSEQLASKLRVLAALVRADSALQGDRASARALRDSATRMVDTLLSRQRTDGAIGYWGRDDEAWPWLTAYVGQSLLDARDLGVQVDSSALIRLGNSLGAATATIMRNPSWFDRRDSTHAVVGMLAFWRRAGQAAPFAAESLLVAHASQLAWEDQLELARTVATSRPDFARATLRRALTAVRPLGDRAEVDDTALPRDFIFTSHIRPLSRLLGALLAIEPEHPMLGAVVRSLARQGVGEHGWAWNTQDYATSSVALAEVARRERASVGQRITVRIGGAAPVSLTARDTIVSDSGASLTGAVVRRNGRAYVDVQLSAPDATTPVFYAATVTEVTRHQPVRPGIRGFFVERWYEGVRDGKPVTTVRAGDLVRVHFRVTVPTDRQFVALEDLLPAGLEPVDRSLRTTGTLRAETVGAAPPTRRDPGANPAAQWRFGGWNDGRWTPWEHTELHDDRVLYFARMLWRGRYTASYIARATSSGVFVRPPAYAEEMYNPAASGNTDGGRFTVLR